MRVGFAGTQNGMTLKQKENLRILVVEIDPDEFHHGDCIGADAEAHAIAAGLKIPVVLHPPSNPSKRAYSLGAGEIRGPLPYLDRNQQIVLETDVLIATPKGRSEELRSGTWSTVRYARKQGRVVYILYPDGTIVSNASLPAEKASPR